MSMTDAPWKHPKLIELAKAQDAFVLAPPGSPDLLALRERALQLDRECVELGLIPFRRP